MTAGGGSGVGGAVRRMAAAVVARELPAPPRALRRGPLRAVTWPHGVHEPRTALLLGRAAGTALAICFVTGIVSHLHQHPPAWLDVPSRPVWGYRFTQGVHVATGIAAVPLVLVKLWVVYPRLFTWPPLRTVGHALERLLLVPLVAGVLFELTTGLLNIVQWYPWGFAFTATHWAVAWLVVGALLVHLAVKAPAVRRAPGRAAHGAAPRSAGADGSAVAGEGEPATVGEGGPAAAGESGSAGEGGPAVAGESEPATAGIDRVSRGGDKERARDRGTEPSGDRRALLLGAGAAVGAVTLATIGQTVAPLSGLSVLAPRRAGGPQGVPVNRTAAAAGVAEVARDPGWRLLVRGAGADRPLLELGLPELASLSQRTVVLPIACVEGWSVRASWSGVRLRDVLELAGLDPGQRLRAVSLETDGPYATSPIGPSAARDPLTLVALGLDGHPLSLDHGYPARLIAPDRPGVQQTKWLAAIEVVDG